jgi:hypothetical protein
MSKKKHILDIRISIRISFKSSLKWLVLLAFFVSSEANPTAVGGRQDLPNCSVAHCETSVSPKPREQPSNRKAAGSKSGPVLPTVDAKSNHCVCRPIHERWVPAAVHGNT